MKPCVSSHGGDQYLSMQSLLLTRFYALFYASINIGAITYVPRKRCGAARARLPSDVRSVGCFGANACYPLAFMVPSVFFLVALVVFVVGKKHYRIVPPAGTFLPWVGLKAVAKASFRFLKAPPAERKSTDGWLNFVSADYGKETTLSCYHLRPRIDRVATAVRAYGPLLHFQLEDHWRAVNEHQFRASHYFPPSDVNFRLPLFGEARPNAATSEADADRFLRCPPGLRSQCRPPMARRPRIRRCACGRWRRA
ncbi:MAG: POT family-domain-containing protein [Olpidium bornovanus]|uniref:POT family-domain-containing protein n=1 Tax=Olpidium bornovanus TaxID=278681 RepID=A0A8H7ZWT3_9FUNG|nr:MAG: POT family-domain-containing protein [Olpidium bornovanus]